MNADIIVFPTKPFSIDPEAINAREELLSRTALVARVNSPESQKKAVEMQLEIHKAIKSADAQCDIIVEPAAEGIKEIKKVFAEYAAELVEEKARISKLVNDYVTVEDAKARARQNLANQRLSELEKEREQALAKVATEDDRDEVLDKYARKAQEEVAAATPSERTEGQRVKYTWKVEITNVDLLYRSAPDVVKLIPQLRKLYDLLDSGFIPKGITAEKIAKSSVVIREQQVTV